MGVKTDPEELDQIVANLKRENELEHERIKERIREAKEEVQQLVEKFLKIDPEIKKIVLFGSLAKDRVSSRFFDIDLAVRSNEYLKLVSCSLKSSFPVDVVDLDNLPAHILDSIEKRGKILYEKR